jgi:hypothetical protein
MPYTSLFPWWLSEMMWGCCHSSAAAVTHLQLLSPICSCCHSSAAAVIHLQLLSFICSCCHTSAAAVTHLQLLSLIYSCCHSSADAVTNLQLLSLICSCYLNFCTIHILNTIDTGNANANTEENIQMCQFHIGKQFINKCKWFKQQVLFGW